MVAVPSLLDRATCVSTLKFRQILTIAQARTAPTKANNKKCGLRMFPPSKVECLTLGGSRFENECREIRMISRTHEINYSPFPTGMRRRDDANNQQRKRLMSDNANYSQKEKMFQRELKVKTLKRQEIDTYSCNFKPQFPTPRPCKTAHPRRTNEIFNSPTTFPPLKYKQEQQTCKPDTHPQQYPHYKDYSTRTRNYTPTSPCCRSRQSSRCRRARRRIGRSRRPGRGDRIGIDCCPRQCTRIARFDLRASRSRG